MKKKRMVLVISIVLVIALTLSVGLAFAKYGEPGPNADGTGFLDANGDGLCDNAGTGQEAGPHNGQAIQQGNHTQDGTSSGFADIDGDGVCDNLR